MMEYDTGYRPRARDYFIFFLAVLAMLGALGAFLLTADQAVKSWPGPRGGRKLRVIRPAAEDESESVSEIQILTAAAQEG